MCVDLCVVSMSIAQIVAKVTVRLFFFTFFSIFRSIRDICSVIIKSGVTIWHEVMMIVKNKLSRHFLLLFVRNTGGFSVIGEKREFFVKFLDTHSLDEELSQVGLLEAEL